MSIEQRIVIAIDWMEDHIWVVVGAAFVLGMLLSAAL